jgi:hypothetical protein
MSVVWLVLGLVIGAEYNEYIRPVTRLFIPWLSREKRDEDKNNQNRNS